MEKIKINNKPESNIIWKGLGRHFDSISQIINEFLDNSISNFIAHNPIIKNIVITIVEKRDKMVYISIEDSGTGIKNIDSAFTLGSQDAKESPMNEHGFGFKHALATANPSNDTWYIVTRTMEQYKQSSYTEIKASYNLENFYGINKNISDTPWPGQLNGSGTFLSFECTDSLFSTVREGLKGNYGFDGKIKLLIEDIGFTYSNLIKEDIANISLVYTDILGSTNNKNIKSVEPDYEKFITPAQGKTKVSLDGQMVNLEYEFGVMKESDYDKYYKRNMSTSGVEIRLNGRVIAMNLFKEIWGIEKHNSYNYLLVRLNLKSENSAHLPTTRTSKNGIRKGDKKLEDLFSWVKSYLPLPQKSIKDIDHEVDLFEKLAELKRKQLPDPKTISIEQKVFQEIKESIRIDLYEMTDRGLTLYEGKKDRTTIQDLYQLKMYWDGCVIDGLKPDKGILIASYHTQPVKDMLKYINQMRDSNNNNYNFELKTWSDEGIEYPSI